jgi:hypothetical protein
VHGNQTAVYLTVYGTGKLFVELLLSQGTTFPKPAIRLPFVKHTIVFFFATLKDMLLHTQMDCLPLPHPQPSPVNTEFKNTNEQPVALDWR